MGRCFACHHVAGPSSVIPNSTILNHLSSVSISHRETWFAYHVCKKAYTWASASRSSRYFEYGYGIVFTSKGCDGGGVSIRNSVLSAFRASDGVRMHSSTFSTRRSGGGVRMRLVLSLDCCSTSIMGNVVLGSDVGVCSESSSSGLSRVS